MPVIKTDNFDGNLDYGEQFELIYTIEALTAGNWVAFVSANTANPAAAREFSIQTSINTDTDGPPNVCGIAVESPTAAGMTRIQVAGRYATANVATSVANGDALVASAVEGRAQDADQLADGQDQMDYRHCGIVLDATDAATNLSIVRIIRHPHFA